MTSITCKLATFVGGLLLAVTLGCASTAKQEGTGEYADDTVIATKVKAAVFPAGAEIRGNRCRNVQGRGSAEWVRDLPGCVDKAGHAHVGGVKSVKSDMRLK